MRYLYLVRKNEVHTTAFRKPEDVTLYDHHQAKEHGLEWLTEEEVISRNISVPDPAGHWVKLTPAKTLNIRIKVQDNAIHAYWLDKWRAIREYRVKNHKPSSEVMREFEKTFRLNAGIPINFDLQFFYTDDKPVQMVMQVTTQGSNQLELRGKVYMDEEKGIHVAAKINQMAIDNGFDIHCSVTYQIQ